MPFKPRIIIILIKHTYPFYPLTLTISPTFNLYKLETLPAHTDPEHNYSYRPEILPEHIDPEHFEILPEHIDPEHIPEPTSEYITPLSHWKMVNCTLNKNEY